MRSSRLVGKALLIVPLVAMSLSVRPSAASDVATMRAGVPGVAFKMGRNTFWACPGGTLQDDHVPWVDADHIVHLAERPIVPDGATQHSVFSMTLTDSGRHLVGNGLPSTPAGAFPVPSDSAAYPYYAAAKGGPGSPYGTRADVPLLSVPFDIRLPRNPRVADKPTCLDLATVGILLNGARLADPIEIGYFDSQAGLPLDKCFGHTSSKNGSYHIHAFSPDCFDPGRPGKHSPLVGYALDGFGIFGPQGEDGHVITNDELDACHGRTDLIDWDGRKVMMYHYVLNYQFPYSLGCFKGTPIADRP